MPVYAIKERLYFALCATLCVCAAIQLTAYGPTEAHPRVP